MGFSGWVHLDVALVVRETALALLRRLEEDGREVWVPKSQIDSHDDYEAGDADCTVSVCDWWAEKNGLA
jgi:hypothetical protein